LKTYLAGAVGDDEMGGILLEGMRRNGVDTRHVKTVHGSSGFSVANASGDGSVFATIVRGANYEVTEADIDRIEPLLRDAGVLLLQLEIPVTVVEYAIARARMNGCKILLNAAPATGIGEASLKNCDIIVMNEVEAEYYTGSRLGTVRDAERHVADFSRRMRCACVFTLGEKGAVVAHEGKVEQYPPCEVSAVETTGAGDSFMGGLAYSVIEGMSLERAMAFSSCCSGCTVQGVGAQQAMPSLPEVGKMLQEYRKLPIPAASGILPRK
jgi:ribokinase